MSTRRFKRPSSARRNIRQESFTPFVSCTRLRNVQSLLVNNPEGKDEVDSILCILGIDSRYNDGTRELVDYLLFDFFNTRKAEIEKSGYPEEVIDDMIVLVKKQCVHVYCNPINYMYLLPYIAHWRNLRIHCLTDEKFQDEEYAEEFKIHSFVTMTTGCSMIGIPYNSTGQKLVFDKMVIERWPIVQAFALEGFGRGGFFTMHHEVVDVSHSVSKLYDLMDPVFLETIITERVRLFEGQWGTMLSTVDIERTKDMAQLTESYVCEPLRTYYNHGRVGTARSNKVLESQRQPYVLFGSHSSKATLDVVKSQPTSINGTITDVGLGGQHAKHMVCQAVSPKGPLCCARSYFFTNSHTPLGKNNSLADKTDSSDIRLLNSLYLCMVEAVASSIETYAQTLSLSKAEDDVKMCLEASCKKRDVSLPASFWSNAHVDFRIDAVDNHGRSVSITDNESLKMVKYACLTLYDVPSVEHKGDTLGSLVFGESFLESSIQVICADGSKRLDSELTVLTRNVPRFITWTTPNEEQGLVERMKQLTQQSTEKQQFGRVLIDQQSAKMLSDTNLCNPDEGELTLYERSIVFINSRHGPTLLPLDQFESLSFYDGDSPSDSPSVVAFVIIRYNKELCSSLPSHLQSPSSTIILALTPKSKAYKAFFREVLPLWRKESHTPSMELLTELHDNIKQLHSHLQLQYTNTTSAKATPLKKAVANLPNLHTFLDHFEGSSVSSLDVSYKDVNILTKRPYDSGNFDDSNQLVVTILTGVPGSHKENLCTTLANLSKEEGRWVVLRQPLDNTEAFNAESLHGSLYQTYHAQKKRKPGSAATKRKMRALIVTPGFTDIVEVVRAVMTHPDKEVLMNLRIGAVTACVDPLNTYMQDRLTLPHLLEQCGQGWVNIYTNMYYSLNPKNQDLADVQHLIRAVNSDVALLLAPKGEVTRTPDLDLILSDTAYNRNDLARARHLSYPGWSICVFIRDRLEPTMQETCLKFSQPLDRQRFASRLRGLKALLKRNSFEGNIYVVKGRSRFTDSQSMMEFEYVTLSGSLSLVPAEVQPTPPSRSNGPSTQTNGHSNCTVFIGVDLQEEVLKNWLRQCAPQKPVKKNHKKKFDLTPAEKQKIHKDHHLEPPPEGWFYNGTHFVCMTGEKSDKHPDMDKFIADYLTEVNNKIDKHNADIDAQVYLDLFD
ncbi:unnamed protein product [Owenia fusiformis]|uniref:Uncharacterized protein n=1 Tax=Owenia fusiformis TaxID=6347 RepID=A0A8S4NML7_OWEFU|nr:unnamed protein product [Owenia fusiformis]